MTLAIAFVGSCVCLAGAAAALLYGASQRR